MDAGRYDAEDEKYVEQNKKSDIKGKVQCKCINLKEIRAPTMTHEKTKNKRPI